MPISPGASWWLNPRGWQAGKVPEAESIQPVPQRNTKKLSMNFSGDGGTVRIQTGVYGWLGWRFMVDFHETRNQTQRAKRVLSVLHSVTGAWRGAE